MNYSTLNHILMVLPVILLLLIHICESKPWWPSNEAGYDASLDPVAWSRSFVPDQIRKTRYNAIPEPRSKHRHRQSSNLWYQKPVNTYPKVFGNAKNYKRFLRRRQKMEARQRYAYWRQ